MIRLLDENISPALVRRLADIGVYAQSVPHVGLAGRADREIWNYALDHDFAVVRKNAQDFVELLNVDVHPGLIVFRESGLSQAEQWGRCGFVGRPQARNCLQRRPPGGEYGHRLSGVSDREQGRRSQDHRRILPQARYGHPVQSFGKRNDLASGIEHNSANPAFGRRFGQSS